MLSQGPIRNRLARLARIVLARGRRPAAHGFDLGASRLDQANDWPPADGVRAWRIALVLATGLLVSAGLARGGYKRRTAIVDAVEKTRDGIVTLKVILQGDWGKQTLAGTGVIVDERGYLITNHHLIENALEILVTLADNTTLKARVHTALPRYDLAILRVPVKKRLKALAFGPGSDLLVGEPIIAVGNPFGFANTVSTGIISALGREITMPSDAVLTNLIQHNASINPGNSGGPLLNINGEVIGINVALRDGAQGISFALNADTVKRVLSRTLSAVKVSRVGHGLECDETVTPRGKGLPSPRALAGQHTRVVVRNVSGAAARAGLRQGDVIVKVGDLAVSNRFDLERALWGYKPGEKARASILRDGKLTHVSFRLGGLGSKLTSAADRTRR
jgi:serine protease Do